MSDPRGPGIDTHAHAPVIVARGKIRVDARKAIAKLRDHMLVDLHLYATEIARVAVAVGATKLDIEWDADDVIITFDGRALPAEDIARARDHVLSPESGVTDGDALRVLGIGISAALGLGPSFVDVFTSDSDAACAKVRFEAKHIDEDASAAAPTPTQVKLPAKMPCPGMRVHVRRRVGMEILARAVRRDVPREIALLLSATRDSPLALNVNGAVPTRAEGPAVLVRVDLDEPSATRATLEVLAPWKNVAPHTLFLDLGVHLAESPGVGLRAEGDGDLPVRVLIDARRLPTNASRSEVRMDTELVRRIRGRVPTALAAALAALEAVVVRGEARAGDTSAELKIGHSVEVLPAPPEIYEQALGAIAADVALAMRAGKKVTNAETALLSLPLLRDAVGRAMALADIRGGTNEHPLLVYTGNAPAPIELAAWLTDVVWQRGATAERAFAALPQTSANERVALAREGQARRARAMEHPASRPVLPASSSYLLKQAFAVRTGPYAGLEGEVAVVRRESGYRRSSSARLFVDERLLATMQLPGVALPVEMALAWPNGFRPSLAYDGVEPPENVSKAVVYALRLAAIAVGEQLGVRDMELARLAMVACANATQMLGDTSPALASLGKLAREAVWPTTDGAFVSFAVLDAYARRTGALCVAAAGAHAPSRNAAPDGRPVLVADHVKELAALLPKDTRVVDYLRVLAQPETAVSEALALQALNLTCPLKVSFQHELVQGFVGIGPNRKRVFHAGMLLSDEAFGYRHGPVLVAIEDGAAVPTPDLRGLLWSAHGGHSILREQDALLELVLDACERMEIDPATVEDYLAPAKRKLEDRVKGGRERNAEWALAMLKRLMDLPALVARCRRELARTAVLARPIRAASATDPTTTATVSGRNGSVIVTLLRDGAEARGQEVFFQGRPVCATTLFDLPIQVVIDLAREELLADWTTLAGEGTTWARSSAIEAALKLLGDLARTEAFTNDVAALRLCDAMMARDTAVSPRIALLLRTARWPTVQGGTSTLAATPMLCFGTESYAPYRTATEASPYDAPALHLPASPLGQLRSAVLKRAGFELGDVTEPIARLQALRAQAARGRTPPPRLPGTPVHPRLRESLGKLGATLSEGELEIIEGVTSELARAEDSGTVQQVFFKLHVPVRAIFRAGTSTNANEIAEELSVAAAQHLRALGKELEGLPSFVRDRLRSLVCESVRANARWEGDDELAVIADMEGTFWPLAKLIALGTVRRTRDAGPWPLPAPNAPVFSISDDEAKALATMLRFEDVTEAMREEMRGAQRRAVPPLASIELTAEARALCLFTFHLAEDGAQGEIGLLRPAHAQQRGIQVFTSKRPVTTIDDGGGWPTVAAIDITDLGTTVGFDGLADRADFVKIQRRVRVAQAKQTLPFLAAPRDALGVIRLPMPFMARRRDAAGEGRTDLEVACMGVFWLTREWPEAPTVHVDASDGVDPFRAPRMGERERAHHRVLPISGRLYVNTSQARAQGALEAVLEQVVFDRLGPVLTAAARSTFTPATEEIAKYSWDLRLLGALVDSDAVRELALDRPDPILMHVAARRAPHLIDAATGDKPQSAKAWPPPMVAMAPISPTEPTQPTQPTQPTEPDAEPSPASDLDVAPSDTFMEGVVRWIVELVKPPAEPVSETPLTQALEKALTAMKLTDDPVALVVEAKRGRPVRFEAKTKRVIVNTTHASVMALEQHPSRMLFLLAAAVSEINRELLSVTDGEELAVIIDLLREG